MIEGNATMDVSGFVADMIMPVTATVSITDAEIIAGETEMLFFKRLLYINIFNVVVFLSLFLNERKKERKSCYYAVISC